MTIAVRIFIRVLAIGMIIYGAFFTYNNSERILSKLPPSQAHVDEHLIEIYTRIGDINGGITQVHHDYMRLGHYISGHEIKYGHATNFCPECGLLHELDRREEQLNSLVIKLSLRNNQLKETDGEYKKNVEEINRLTIEQTLLRKYLFNAEERAVEVNRIMRDKRLIGNNIVRPNTPNSKPLPKGP